jgi:hypothetical protein
MKALLWLLGALNAFDTIYFHEIRGQLPGRLPGLRLELKLHTGRSFIYAAVFGTLPWLSWRGAWTLALGALLAIEIRHSRHGAGPVRDPLPRRGAPPGPRLAGGRHRSHR